jgi:archaellum component FlaD/FlaE
MQTEMESTTPQGHETKDETNPEVKLETNSKETSSTKRTAEDVSQDEEDENKTKKLKSETESATTEPSTAQTSTTEKLPKVLHVRNLPSDATEQVPLFASYFLSFILNRNFRNSLLSVLLLEK